MKKIVLLAAFFISGCAMKPVVMYEGQIVPRDESAVVSVFGGRVEEKVSLRLVEVDGKEVPGSSNFVTYEVQLKPGTYKLKYYVWHDLRATSWKETYIEIENKLESGHTYFPDADILDGKEAKVWLTDKGENYPVECNFALLASNKYPRENCK